MPPTTTTTKMTEPTVAAIAGSVTKVMPPITPASPASAAAAAEHQHEHPRHVVAQGLDHLGVGQRGLDHQADARARQQQPEASSISHGDRHHEAARNDGKARGGRLAQAAGLSPQAKDSPPGGRRW
jgi:hypothetical protein